MVKKPMQSLLTITAAVGAAFLAVTTLSGGPPFDGSKKTSANLSEADAYALQIDLETDSAEPGSP